MTACDYQKAEEREKRTGHRHQSHQNPAPSVLVHLSLPLSYSALVSATQLTAIHVSPPQESLPTLRKAPSCTTTTSPCFRCLLTQYAEPPVHQPALVPMYSPLPVYCIISLTCWMQNLITPLRQQGAINLVFMRPLNVRR